MAVDLRGNGESDKATSAEAYSIDRLCEDLLAVADAVAAHRFTIWGFSYGANVGRYLAARSDRVDAMVIMGIPFGAATSGAFRQLILDLRTHKDQANFFATALASLDEVEDELGEAVDNGYVTVEDIAVAMNLKKRSYVAASRFRHSIKSRPILHGTVGISVARSAPSAPSAPAPQAPPAHQAPPGPPPS